MMLLLVAAGLALALLQPAPPVQTQDPVDVALLQPAPPVQTQERASVAQLQPAPTVQAQDPADLAMWQSIAHSTNPAEYRAYLETFPNGRFAGLARLRAAGAAPQAAPPPAPVAQAAAPAATVAGVWLRPARASVGLVDGVVLDLDASALRRSSNLRLAIVRVGTPEAIADMNDYFANSTAINATRLHMTVPPGPSGNDEIRLYHVPPFASAPVLAARAAVTIGPGVPGAILARNLAREAAALGPVRFEANHRNRPLLVQAAFLNQQARLAFDPRWLTAFGTTPPAANAVAITVGMPGIAPDESGLVGDVICTISAEPGPTLDRLASLHVGDPVLVRGIPTIWTAATAADPVILKDCTLAP
jgi:hypothetical protein